MDETMSKFDVIIEKLPGWCSVEKGKRMAELAYGASLCVELGVFGGRGLASMALALAEQGFGRADGIDPFEPNAALEGTNAKENDEWWASLDYESIARAAQTGLCELGLYPYSRLVRLGSREAVKYYDDETIDCLHLDANHSEETSCEDVSLWAPKIRHGGYWVFDDTNWESTQKAQRELVALGFVELENHDTWKVYRRQ
jgi:hypothetical protein